MAEKTRTKYQDIPFIIDGVAKIVKSVTSQTTCCDVITKLPKLSAPLAVYASVDGIERELSNKTKLLKVWRANGSSQKFVFVVRRSEAGGKLSAKNRSRLFGERSTCEQQSMISYQDRTKDKLRRFSTFIREKKQRINRRFSEGPSFLHSTLKPKKDSKNMALESTRLSAALDKSSTAFIKPKPTMKRAGSILNVKPRNTLAIIDALGSKKLGFKTRFQPKVTIERKSTESLRSSDTGYSSASSGARNPTNRPVKYQTQLLDDSEEGPRHSTPVVQHTKKRRNTELDNTLSEEFEELQGKSILLRKFMEDQKMYGASPRNDLPAVPEVTGNKRRRIDNRLSLPTFTSQVEKCRMLWNQYSGDSESDCSDDSFLNNSAMDMAFLESFDFETNYMENIFTNQRKTKLRRESAISNLTKFSLHRKEADIAEEAENSYDYSFDCSFQRMDESQAAGFGAEFHQQFDNANNDSDCTVDSFMNTRDDIDVFNNKQDNSFSESDEGIGSSSGGSVTSVPVAIM